MGYIAKIGETAITKEDFIKLLRLNGKINALIEEIIKEKLLILAAKRKNISVSDEEVQERSEQLRRARGLHRAKDTLDFLNAMRITIDEFEEYIKDALYREKIMGEITKPTVIEEYFQLNLPKFDRAEISHIVVDSQSKAKEIMALLLEEPDSFMEMAKAHSVADTAVNGGKVGRLSRGILPSEVESKIFNATAGEILGPFQFDDGTRYEIFRLEAKIPASLDGEMREEVKHIVFNEWLKDQLHEHKIEIS